MHSTAIASAVFACVFGGALLGLWLNARLPPHHVDKKTQGLVKLGMGTIATLMALVLGLMVATAKASFDATATQTKEFAAKLVQLDRVLARYGPETASARRLLRQYLALKLRELWPERPHQRGAAQSSVATTLFDRAGDEILGLTPADDVHKALQARALSLGGDLGQTRLLLMTESAGGSIPGPFLVILTFWATILFVSFGLFAPRHATAIAVLFVCALSIAAAIFVILEMDRPFGGFIRVPSAPVRNALVMMGRAA